MKRVLVATGGGDCPGLNAVIRGIVYRAAREKDWEVLGSIQSFDGILKDETEVRLLDKNAVRGIHYQGGTIIGTTTKGGPFAWPVKKEDGTVEFEDRSQYMIDKLKDMGVEAVISIGGDGSQRISKKLQDRGLNIIGVPKTIDNDLKATDFTFGFQTAVEIATDAVDKLNTTAASHNRILILEVMGRDAGWIALNAALAGGAEVCIIPEIPYDIKKVVERIQKRYDKDGRGFANIVIAEGAMPKGGKALAEEYGELGNENLKLSGAANRLAHELKANGITADIRTTVLGHLQRGGIPCAFDRNLATSFGVKAFEMVLEQQYGQMVAYRNFEVVSVPLEEAIGDQKLVDPNSQMVHTAKGVGISFGD